MDLTALLLRVAARRPHVLLVEAPGGFAVRLALEAELARRGWPLATAPADADILAVPGVPGPDLAAVVDAVWAQVPAPRASTVLARPADVHAALDHAAAALADAGRQRSDAPAGPRRRGHGEHGGQDEHAGDDEHDGRADDHTRDETHGGAGGHGGHQGQHGGGTTLPGDLSMAGVGEDRDGLTLDRLHVVLGPVLPDWPAGLVVRVTLQGDVIQEAVAELLDPADHGGDDLPAAVVELDGLARFLGVAGWADPATRCRAVRDRLLADPTDGPAIAEGLSQVARVQRSRLLQWSLRGVRAGATDVAELVGHRLARLRNALDGVTVTPRAAVDAGELASALVGAEFAAARLIVAATDLRTGATAPAGGASGG